MLERWDKGALEFVPTCQRSTYNIQIKAMTDYIAVLEARAVIEEIELPEWEIETMAIKTYSLKKDGE